MVAAADRTEWVQPIVVDKAGSHRATVQCAAVSSVLAWLHTRDSDPAPWQAWLSGPFTKTVRRCPGVKLDRIADTLGATTVQLGDSRAAALAPVRYADMPRDIARLQVAGTDLPRHHDIAAQPQPARVHLSVDGALTTGKAAAQAAHALFAWALNADHCDLAVWRRAPLSVDVTLVDADTLAAHARTAGAVVIRDAGFTEVAPGTLTAVALPCAAVNS